MYDTAMKSGGVVYPAPRQIWHPQEDQGLDTKGATDVELLRATVSTLLDARNTIRASSTLAATKISKAERGHDVLIDLLTVLMPSAQAWKSRSDICRPPDSFVLLHQEFDTLLDAIIATADEPEQKIITDTMVVVDRTFSSEGAKTIEGILQAEHNWLAGNMTIEQLQQYRKDLALADVASESAESQEGLSESELAEEKRSLRAALIDADTRLTAAEKVAKALRSLPTVA
jgi:hypothetical protein